MLSRLVVEGRDDIAPQVRFALHPSGGARGLTCPYRNCVAGASLSRCCCVAVCIAARDAVHIARRAAVRIAVRADVRVAVRC